MTIKKKLLVLTPRFPYPIIGGDRRRIYTICQTLSQYFDLTLLSLVDSHDEMQLEVPDDGVFNRVERIFLPKWLSRLNVINALITGESLQVAYYKSPQFKARVEALVSEHDLALAHLIRTGAYIEHLNIPKLLEMTDAVSLNYLRLAELKGGRYTLRNWIYRIERKRSLRVELRQARVFNHSFLVSGVDRTYLLEKAPQLNSLISVAHLGIDVDSFELIPPCKTHNSSVAFVGNMLTTQNLDAAEWFASHVMPILLTSNPMLTFKVIGIVSEKGRALLERYSGVRVLGRVDSIRDALSGSFAAVCPMRFGAGVQTKVLEYMALGVPVVATPMGNEGIDAPSEAMLIASSPDEMAGKLLLLTSDELLRRSMAIAARDFVKAHYDGATVSLPIVEKILQII